MRKIIIIFFVFIVIQGCEKVFHDSDVDLYRISDMESIDAALNGMYNRLAKFMKEYYISQIIKGDDLTYTYYDNRLTHIGKIIDEEGHFIFTDTVYGGYSSHIRTEQVSFQIWRNIYNTIISANNIISQYEKKELDTKYFYMVGEAYFIRAYCYLRMVRVFGKGPLVLDTDVDYTLDYSMPKEIYLAIEEGLKKAIKILPDNNASARVSYVTPHRGTAKSLLAMVYLEMAGYPLKENTYYDISAKFAKDVIDSADFFGYGLLNDYSDVWDRAINNNEESVFSVYYNAVSEYSIPVLNSIFWEGMGNENTSFYSGEDLYQSLNMNLYIDGVIIVENNFYNNYPANYRRDITFMNHLEGYFYTVLKLLEEPPVVTDSTYFNHYYNDIKQGDNIVYLKHYVLDEYDFFPARCGLSIYVVNYAEKANVDNTSLYVFRYPHVLLTYAEAKARSGNLDASAYEAVNMVRRRANKVDIHSPSAFDLTPDLSPMQFADSVVQERAWEFCGEMEGRWFDLLRLEMVEKLPELRDPNEGLIYDNPITEEDYYLPIPEKAAIWFE